MTEWEIKTVLSDGTSLTGAEYRALVADGTIMELGNGMLAVKQEKWPPESNSGTPTT